MTEGSPSCGAATLFRAAEYRLFGADGPVDAAPYRTETAKECWEEMPDGPRARETETDARNPAFLGWHASGRAASATLRFLRACLFPATPVLSVLRLPRGLDLQGERQGQALQLRDPSPPRPRLHPA